jgi:hypothetical protein
MNSPSEAQVHDDREPMKKGRYDSGLEPRSDTSLVVAQLLFRVFLQQAEELYDIGVLRSALVRLEGEGNDR